MASIGNLIAQPALQHEITVDNRQEWMTALGRVTDAIRNDKRTNAELWQSFDAVSLFNHQAIGPNLVDPRLSLTAFEGTITSLFQFNTPVRIKSAVRIKFLGLLRSHLVQDEYPIQYQAKVSFLDEASTRPPIGESASFVGKR